MLIAAVLCVGIGAYPAVLYSLLPYDTGYNPYDATHVLAQTQLLFFSALAFTLLLMGGIYPAEQRAINVDSDWFYRKAARGLYAMLEDLLNPINEWCEGVVRGFASWVANFFKDATAKLALFFSVNVWLAQGIRDKRLALKKQRLYNDILQGSLPIGIGAAVAISFIILIFILI